MNQGEKEAYLREYSILKNEGEPFFPYSVSHDAIMACIVMAVIIFFALMFGAELGPKADPTTTTYVPRPDWYFFFLFEVLRVMRNVPKFTPMATIGVPTICMILLFLLPFYDRGTERRIERRPVAPASQLAQFKAGADVVGESGCLACHVIGDNGNNGPGPVLTNIANTVPEQQIASTLRNPTPPMPSFKNLPTEKFNNLVYFLSNLQ
jgi:quinol---cytochrome c reductase cytochrome c subunit, bacillus type